MATEAEAEAEQPQQQHEPATTSSRSSTASSVIAQKYASGQWWHTKGQVIPERYPTNEEVAAAIEQQVSASVATYRSYRHVAWYTTFVALYLLVLYLQVCWSLLQSAAC